MKLNFQQKLILSFLVTFAVFTAGIVVFERQRIKRYKTEALRERLDSYTDEVFRYIQINGSADPVDSLLTLMPPKLRLTLIDRAGKVMFDNALPDPGAMENHFARPEIAEAREKGFGTFVRTSASNNIPYLYYAKDSGNALIVRTALPYDIQVRSFLKPDNAFLYFVVGLFLAGMFFIYHVGRYFGRSVRQLRDFPAALAGGGRTHPLRFPDDEFGEIAARLADDFNRIGENKKQLAGEREKLLLHIQTSAEGVCFFNPDRRVAFYNGLFLQYFNALSDETPAVGKEILGDAVFAGAAEFLDNPGGDDYFETRIGRRVKEYMLRLNIFGDGSFEIILTDVTTEEKNRRLKREMTGNIAHELRTPVTSIRGFMEILLDNELDGGKTREYLERAYSQTKTLSELIADMSLLTRIDERHEAFDFADVDIGRLLDKVRSDTAPALAGKNISFTADIPRGLIIKGNESLLYSVFRNLTDNVIRHAGEGIAIEVGVEDAGGGTARFSFADTGGGIAGEGHLDRLFERFYRVNEGRTRDTGGSGLGLSIVKNAVQLHGGTISVRNKRPHGLEFTITLPGLRNRPV